ncbi:MAG: hypothetical protein JXR97_11895, partial [Planctomycetes bacterium]|nr:hypothetical protein [Planctomycetota bacterium]
MSEAEKLDTPLEHPIELHATPEGLSRKGRSIFLQLAFFSLLCAVLFGAFLYINKFPDTTTLMFKEVLPLACLPVLAAGALAYHFFKSNSKKSRARLDRDYGYLSAKAEGIHIHISHSPAVKLIHASSLLGLEVDYNISELDEPELRIHYALEKTKSGKNEHCERIPLHRFDEDDARRFAESANEFYGL